MNLIYLFIICLSNNNFQIEIPYLKKHTSILYYPRLHQRDTLTRVHPPRHTTTSPPTTTTHTREEQTYNKRTAPTTPHNNNNNNHKQQQQ